MDPPPSDFRTAKAIIKKTRILFIDIDANKLTHLSTKVHVDAMAGKRLSCHQAGIKEALVLFHRPSSTAINSSCNNQLLIL
jgi:hypothetical protein